MKQELSTEQKESAFYNECEGAILVEAAAGSGKTRILTERVRYLLTEKKNKFFSVLCLTFTNKAADEMKERLKDIPNLKERVFIGTFHEFCLEKIIRTRIREIGVTEVPHIFDEDDKTKILEEVFLNNPIFEDDYKDLPQKEQKKRIVDYLNVISETKRELVVNVEKDRPEWSFKRRALFEDFNDRLVMQNAMDYDDILLYAYRILSENQYTASLYRRSYQYVLIDEAQDLNYAQYQLIRAICGEIHKNVIMVGDPKQAIYGFNGASTEFMKNHFLNDFNAEVKEIKNNYRSAKNVLSLAQKVLNSKSLPLNYFEGIAEILPLKNEKEEAIWIINKIKEWLEIGFYQENEIKEPILPENIAILARNRFVFTELKHQLLEDKQLCNLFYERKGIEKFVPDSLFIRIFDLGLRVISNPIDVLHFRQIINLLNINLQSNGNNLNGLLTLTQYESSELTKMQLEILVCAWNKLNNNNKYVGRAIEDIQREIEKIELKEDEKLRIDFDIKELKQYWGNFQRKTPIENQTLSNFRYFLALNGNAKINTKGITLATVHTVKGLEYEIVFLMGMNEGVFPDYRANTKTKMEEERNNAYVAITRAKRCIYITYPQCRKMPWGEKDQKISSFLAY